METFKLVIAFLLSPLLISLILQLTGWLLLRRRSARNGLILIGIGGLGLAIGSLSGFTYELRRASEAVYPPLKIEAPLSEESSVTIVVLGTGFSEDSGLPPNSRVSGTFLARLLEGVRVYRAIPKSTLLISIAGDAAPNEKLEFVSQMDNLLHLDSERVQVIIDAESTYDEAEAVSVRFPNSKTVLATSAGHMVRAVGVFRDKGLSVIPAPTDYVFQRAGSPDEKNWPRWIPSTDGINGNHQWLYERIALLWHAVSGG